VPETESNRQTRSKLPITCITVSIFSLALHFVIAENPNGRIIHYIIYESFSEFPLYMGLSQEFVYLRLQPYTNYSLQLHVCTAVGCASAPWQTVTTAEIAPDNQPPPVLISSNATSVTLQYVSLVVLHGFMLPLLPIIDELSLRLSICEVTTLPSLYACYVSITRDPCPSFWIMLAFSPPTQTCCLSPLYVLYVLSGVSL